jgi:hypothetical protein
MKCDMCNTVGNVSICCSTTGGVLFAYCDECLKSNRQPYGALVASICGNSMDDIAEWYKPVILANLEFHNKTVEQFFDDVREFDLDYIKYCEENE